MMSLFDKFQMAMLPVLGNESVPPFPPSSVVSVSAPVPPSDTVWATEIA
jgi:hypothetical protein